MNLQIYANSDQMEVPYNGEFPLNSFLWCFSWIFHFIINQSVLELEYPCLWKTLNTWAVFKTSVGWWVVGGWYYPPKNGDFFSQPNRGIPTRTNQYFMEWQRDCDTVHMFNTSLSPCRAHQKSSAGEKSAGSGSDASAAEQLGQGPEPLRWVIR